MNLRGCLAPFTRLCWPSRTQTRVRAMSQLPLHVPRVSAMQSDSGSHERFGAHNPEFTVPGLAKESPWNQKSLVRKYPPLKEDTSCDVVVIGAGIAGLSCAYRLVREGKDVVLLESRVRGGGQTGRTTAHIMTWLDDYYFECMSMHGDEKTRLVGESLLAAVDWIENTCKEEGIECEFNRVDGILYPHEDSEIKTLEQELDAAHKAGLKDTKMVDLGRAPEVGGIGQALVFPRDADFHPLKYLDGLAEAIVKRGGRIFEGTKAWTVENDVVETEHGKKIRCDHIVLATNSPINHNLAVHARQLPYRSYVVGILCPRSAFARANYWSTEEPYTYTRAVDWDKDNYMIIVGGQDHKIGNNPSYDVYAELENHARQCWTGLRETALRWSGMVFEPVDMLHLHGRNPVTGDDNQYIITGDSGQGMTGGTIGANVVSDLILGRQNPWADLYSPSRPPPAKSLLGVAEEGAATTASFAERVLPKVTLSYDVAPGEGTVVQRGTEKVALYCDKDGNKHAMSAVCPHLGCLVRWNTLDGQWDCPCHGSQFSAAGELINGPAKADLKKLEW